MTIVSVLYLEQVGHGRSPAADAGLRRADVVPWKGILLYSFKTNAKFWKEILMMSQKEMHT